MFGCVRRHVAAVSVDMSCFLVWLDKVCKNLAADRRRGCSGRGPIYCMVRRGPASVGRASSSSPSEKKGGSLVERQAWHERPAVRLATATGVKLL